MPDSPQAFEYNSRDAKWVCVYFFLGIALFFGVIRVVRASGLVVTIPLLFFLSAAVGVCLFALHRWVWSTKVLVRYELKEHKLFIKRTFERRRTPPRQEQYDLGDLIAIQVFAKRRHEGLGLLFQGIEQPARFVRLSLGPIDASSRAVQKTRETLVRQQNLYREIETEARSALVERWNQLDDYGRYRLIVHLAEFSIFRAEPSSWLMLQASFQEIWEAIRRGALALGHGLVRGWFWAVWFLFALFGAIWLVTDAVGKPEWYKSLGEWYKGLPTTVQFMPFFGAFFVGAALVIIQWFKPLSQEDATQETALAQRLADTGGKFDTVVKLVDDRLDRVRSILDRATLITAAIALLPNLLHRHQGESPAMVNYITLAGGSVVIVMQLYRLAQTRMLRLAKTACLVAQNVLTTETRNDSTLTDR